MAELFNSLPAASTLRTFVQYLIAFYSRPEAAADVIFGVTVDCVGADVRVKVCDPMLNGSRAIRGAYFV